MEQRIEPALEAFPEARVALAAVPRCVRRANYR
jgi:hypothetical protein